ncbi:MAG: hypothetical protein ABI904_18435, partial [Chloroflexota bacterium]
MNNKLTSILLIGLFLLTGCGSLGGTPLTPTAPAPAPLVFITTETPMPVPTAIVAVIATASPIPPGAANVCADPQATALIDSLKKAILTSDGALLSSLVSPNGMEVRWVRYGSIVTYTREQA